MVSQPGSFIVLEGTDQAGKTTQAKRLVNHLREQGIEVLHTREPGGTPLAEELRSIILSNGITEYISPVTELLVMFAARNQHLINTILPALNNGVWVVCERFVDTTYAYQVRGGETNPVLFNLLEGHIVKDHHPDVTFFLDLPEEVYRERLLARTRDEDRLDNQTSTFYKRVREGLRERSRLPDHIVIDANQSEDEVSTDIQEYLKTYTREVIASMV